MTETKHQVLAQVILGYITENPERHNQSEWVQVDSDVKNVDEVNACGTTACVAGYAVLFTDDRRFQFTTNALGYVHMAVRPEHDDDNDIGQVFFEAGKENLGLKEADAVKLFYRTSNDQAKKALTCLARGEQIDWDEISRHLANEDDEDEHNDQF